jgi:aspartate kinase
MSLVVQKFGGTSVADAEKILAAARKAVRAQQQGFQVVMVVSAMGKNTDVLIDLASQVNERPPAREMDMLLSTGEQVSVALMAMAVNSLGYKAVSLTGAQIGIKTDSSHTKARIHSISTDRMKQLLDDGNIVIAAGFQGIDENLNITTLGRGGSDTTAVALAAVLQADACEIYTDVDGIYTTDPRILPEACLVPQVCYDEMLELASLGAGVMHSRSIEFGKKFNVPIHVRSSLSDVPGSVIVDHSETEMLPVSGAALTKDEALVSILDVPDVPGTIHRIFAPIAAKKITVDMIVQNVGDDGRTTISFTVPRDELSDAIEVIEKDVETMGGRIGTTDENVSKVSVVGIGMANQTGVADRMFKTLANADVNMQIITTSEIKISALVKREAALGALRSVHAEFELDKMVASSQPTTTPAAAREYASPAEVIDRLQGTGMEDLMIDEITLDDTQSRITLCRIPNQPGVAADMFEQIASAGVFVDMIVQSYSNDEYADITFSVPRDQFDAALAVAESVCTKTGCQRIDHKKSIAKLSVSGIGLRSHTGVAIGMFRALADAGINLEIINTSEVRVNVVVDGDSGQRGLECLRNEFKEAVR